MKERAGTMRDYGRDRLRILLDNVVFEMHNAARVRDPESIHKMRVAIRRFQQGLRIFNQYVPAGSTKKIRRELRDVMKAAGEVRNRDTAMGILKSDEAILTALQKQRLEWKRRLTGVLRDVNRPDLSIKWRTRLELH